MIKLNEILLVVIAVLIGAVLLGFLLSYPLMLLWNGCLVGAIDGVREVTWLQMWGIMILTSVLFKTTVTSK